MTTFKRLKSRLLWKFDIQRLKASATLARTKIGSQVPFIIFAVGIGFVAYALRLIYLPLMWLFLGSILVYIALGYERISAKRAEVEELQRMAAKEPIKGQGSASFMKRS